MRARPLAPSIQELKLFDSCVVGGRITDRFLPYCLTEDTILPTMDRLGISEALVTYNRARLDRPHTPGNLGGLAFCRISPRLHPVWVLEPPRLGDRAAARALVTEMRDHGVRVARLLMGQGASAPLHWWWRDLLEALEARRIPCLLDFGSTDYSGGSTNGVPTDVQINQLRELVLAHPGLPMILSHACGGLGIANSTLPLLSQVPNLHLDITGICDFWRRVALGLGPERVFFATGMPYFEPAILIANVQYYPGLSTAAKRLIGGDNLRRLLEEVQ